MLVALVALVLALTALDHWTTWLCLSEAVQGWQVTEANPLSEWLFAELGLVPGLLLDTAVTGAALGLLVHTELLSHRTKHVWLLLLVATTGYAVANNLDAAHQLGLLTAELG